MILDDFSDFLNEQSKKTDIERLAALFGKNRKWVSEHKNLPTTFIVDIDFVCGLSSLGYELRIVKKNDF